MTTNEEEEECLEPHQQDNSMGFRSATSFQHIEHNDVHRTSSTSTPRHAVPVDCQFVYAEIPSYNDNRSNEWGVFSMVSRSKGSPVRKYGDIVIQWTDPSITRHQKEQEQQQSSCTNVHNSNYTMMDCLLMASTHELWHYTWSGQETGGQFEGHEQVLSVVPGLGMVARTTSTHMTTSSSSSSSSTTLKPNILPLVPRIDEGGLTRFDSPGAGAITHYHNFTWWFSRDVEAGEELFYSDQGKRWIDFENSATATTTTTKSTMSSLLDLPHTTIQPSLQYLKEYGYCIDNMKPGTSRLKDAGRGAFATRDLVEGSIVAPVPVIPIQRKHLQGLDALKKPKEQLLVNYCLGNKQHDNSQWLLFPYSPVVNLINHFHEPNVKLQWSVNSMDTIQHNLQQGELLSTSTASNYPRKVPALHLELVATKPIHQHDEIYLDYGQDWQDAWRNHVDSWKPIHKHYTPSYVMDDAIQMLRTEQEQKQHPYPNNVFTSCFYRYSDRTDKERALANNTTTMTNNNKEEEDSSTKHSQSIPTFRWKLSKGLYDLKNLRPCVVLKRLEASSLSTKGRSLYAVQMLNHPGLLSLVPPQEIIPNHELHIVTHIPRSAIRFLDRAGTTDQHLPTAFRHEIGFPDKKITNVS